MAEDLSRWKPIPNTSYYGYDHLNKYGHRRIGKVVIYFQKGNDLSEQYGGGFEIIGNNVKIWLITGNGRKNDKFVPLSQCKFSKTKQGNTFWYHLIIDEDYSKQQGNNMSANDRNTIKDDEDGSGKEYGLKEKDNVEEPVKFRVRPEQAGIIGRITGRSSAIYQKKRHEDKLNEIWKDFDNTIQKIDRQNEELKKAYVTIPGLEKTLEVTKKEWSEELSSLGNLINKKTSHEKGMWETTQGNRQNRVMKVKQKMIRASVDEMNFNNMMDYIKQYPELQASDIIERAREKADEKRKEIVEAQKELDKTISSYNFILNTFEKLTQDAEEYLTTFEELIKEAEEKVNNSPYNKSKIWGKVLTTAYEQEATRLDLLPYKGKLGARKSDLKRVKDELSSYKRKQFVDIEH